MVETPTPALDGLTINVGHVHVGKHAPGEPWECADDCPHPDHGGPADG